MQAIWLQVLEPPLLASACALGAWGLNHLLIKRKTAKLLPRLTKVYRLLDPLLNEVSGKWSGSQVRFAIELIVVLLADQKISAAELKWAANQIERRYRPSRAAGVLPELLPPGSPERTAIGQLIGAVENNLFSGASPIDAARNLKTLLRL